MRRWCALPRFAGLFLALAVAWPSLDGEACNLVAPKDSPSSIPALQVFLDWDPDRQKESLVLQPAFESDGDPFALIVATPAKPEIVAAPRGFFRYLATFTRLKQRVFPESLLLPLDDARQAEKAGPGVRRPHHVRLLDEGLVDGLDFKTIAAGQQDDLDAWLKEHHCALPPGALGPYVEKKWFLTLVLVDTKILRIGRDGRFHGAVAPFRLTFETKQPVLPLRLTRAGTADRLDLLLYVQAPEKMDLPGDLSYQYHWLALLQNALPDTPKATFPGKGDDWLRAAQGQLPEVTQKGKDLGFTFVKNERPQPNKQGRAVATLEWAKRLTPADMKVLKGETPLSEPVPDPDEGFVEADLRNPQRGAAICRVIRQRLEKDRKERPGGYLVRGVSEEEAKGVRELAGSLRQGHFLTKIRKVFTPEEMADDIYLVPAQLGLVRDSSEYEERLPGAPP